jgi:uncharacterized coiled-coil DUF342 family protein
MYTQLWNKVMADKERRINERSLENLKLGAQARYQGKIRQNVSILPETLEWLRKGGNISSRIDEVVKAAKSGELKSDYTQNRKAEEQQDSSIVYKQIDELKTEVEQLRQERDRLAQELATCQQEGDHRQPELPDLEASGDQYLASLRLGKQAPEYKRTKSTLERFIAFINQA